MKNTLLALILILIVGCKGENRSDTAPNNTQPVDTTMDSKISLETLMEADVVELNIEQANKLIKLPLNCLGTEYPNKLGQTLASKADIQSPKELHPAFYGCFDWHSSVHAHWSAVKLLKQFPKLENAGKVKETLEKSLSKENIQKEIEYFKKEHNTDYERTYGWAWLLKLSQELETWDSDYGEELAGNIKPLAELIESRFEEFLPKLVYPVRVGEHTNTAFALSFAYDYAVATKDNTFRSLIEKRAKEFYLKDDYCPFNWEPSGFDFLSPCLQEIDIMRKILPKAAFALWMEDFMPQLKEETFIMEPGIVGDRKDGKLVHLDGLNFSRAWVFYGLAQQYPEMYGHLKKLGDHHVAKSFPNLVGDSYEGGHWLGSFALYALQESRVKK